jgi:Tol biopolymer transport system component
MYHFTRPFKVGLFCGMLLLVLVACGPAVSRELVTTSPLPTAVQTPPPTVVLPPTEWVPPTSTLPPVPRLVPTPVVTPIPTVAPPILPEVVGRPQMPFWIYYWQGNEVWRVDDRGQERELLLDTYQRLGQWLTAHPMAGSDCCWSGPRVVVSPDGGRLALVVVDKDRLSYKGEPFTFSIYVFEVASRELRLVSEGVQPVWSPDSQRIAFLKERGLWIADLRADKVTLLIPPQQENQHAEPGYWTWSPNGQRIAYRYHEGMVEHPELWIKNIADDSPPYLIPNLSPELYFGCRSWMPDGQNILCDLRDYEMPGSPMTMWAVNIETGDRIQLVQGFGPGRGQWSPDGRWLALSAARLYEGGEEAHDNDLWLVSVDGSQLLRVTSGPPEELAPYWTPDGAHLVFLREGSGLAILSLETGQVISLNVSIPYDSLSNYDYTIRGLR